MQHGVEIRLDRDVAETRWHRVRVLALAWLMVFGTGVAAKAQAPGAPSVGTGSPTATGSMTTQEIVDWGQLIFTIVIAGATVAYVFGTFGLLKANRGMLKANEGMLEINRGMLETNRRTLESMKLSFYGSTWQGIVSNHREMYFKAMDSEDLLSMMFLRKHGDYERLVRDLTEREKIMATIVINHAEACFLHLRFGTLPDEVREPVERGLLTLFSNPAVRKRWDSVKPEYRVREFQDFVNRLIKDGGKTDKGGAHA